MKTTLPESHRIALPLKASTCKKCKAVIYWGKIRGSSKFFPPFATGTATAWHVCGQKHEALPTIEAIKVKLPNETQENTSIQGLIATIRSLSSTLGAYGRPTV